MSTCRTLIVAHGRSEIIFCKNVAKRLKTYMEYDSNNNGKNCIQICHLEERFSSGHYRSELALHNKFKSLEYLSRKDIKMPNLRVFPIMDRDNDHHMLNTYKTQNMFGTSVFRDRITPIYNDPDLDTVLNRCGFKVSHDNVETYDELFNDHEMSEIIDALRKRKDTNLSRFLDHCLSITPSYQNSL